MNIIVKESKLKGMFLKDLAESLGVSLTTVKGWRDGLFRPSAKTAARMRSMGFSEQAILYPDSDV